MKLTQFMYSRPLDENYVLIINTLNNAMDIVTDETYTKLCQMQKGETLEIDEEIMGRLQERDYLFTDAAVEQAVLAELTAQRPGKLHYAICPTHDCNLRCTYCFEKNANVSAETMSRPVLEAALQQIAGTLGESEKDLILYGGEPFMPENYHLLQEILAFARENQLTVGVLTNGTLLDKFYDLVLEYRDVLKRFQLTLDGVRDRHDTRRVALNGEPTFDQIIRNINWLLEHAFTVGVRVSVDEENLEHLEELMQFVQDVGWDRDNNFSLFLAPVIDEHSKEDNLHEAKINLGRKVLELAKSGSGYGKLVNYAHLFDLYGIISHFEEILEGKTRKAGTYHRMDACPGYSHKTQILGADGYIYPCFETVGRPELAIGEFYPVLKFYQTPVMKQVPLLELPMCNECAFLLHCSGGCAFNRFYLGTNFCTHKKEMLDLYVDSIKEKLIALITR